MFGRDLTEQVIADAKGSSRLVPVIVEKCIDAVETFGELLKNYIDIESKCRFDLKAWTTREFIVKQGVPASLS